MATQNNEEGKGGIFGGLKKAPGYAYAKAKQAANAYGVAGTIAASVGGHVSPVIPAFMYARQKYDEHRRGEAIKERRTADLNYNAEADSTLPEVRHMYGAPISDIYNAAFNPIETTKKMLTRLTGRDSAEEPNELPQVVDDADLGISEGSGNMYEGLGESQPGANMYEDIEDQAVNYSLTDGDSTDSMGLDMDEGVGSKQKYDTYGFKSNYEGDYANAEGEWDAIQSAYVDMHNGRGNIKLDSPEGQALNSRFNYIADMIDEANKRRTDEHMRTFGSETAEERAYDTDTRQYDHFGFPSEYVAPSGRGMGGKWENAKDELEGHRNRTTGEIEGLNPDRIKYLEDLIKDAENRKTDSESATPGGGQSSTGGSTRTTAHRPGYDAKNNRGITGALELSAIPHARSQEIQNGRITLKGTVYNIVGNTGDKFLVPDPDQPDYSRRA